MLDPYQIYDKEQVHLATEYELMQMRLAIGRQWREAVEQWRRYYLRCPVVVMENPSHFIATEIQDENEIV